MWFPIRSYTNQKQARSLKFWIQEEEDVYYPCSENKDADQLRSYCEADLCLCFRIGKTTIFSLHGSYQYMSYPMISTAFFSDGSNIISPAIGSHVPSAATILTCWRPAASRLSRNT